MILSSYHIPGRPRHLKATKADTAVGARRVSRRLRSFSSWLLCAVTKVDWWQGAVVAIVALYLTLFAYRDWIPHDEGLLAHSAERVLAGELPHRDFDDTYTGGLSYLHAIAFELFGRRLSSTRTMLFPFVIVFVSALYSLAVRVAAPWLAALVVFTCITWSVSNYFAALPSWYVLFFATFGICGLVRFIDTGHRGWLFFAGMCGGISVLFKISGLFWIAGVLLFLIYNDQVRVQRSVSNVSRPKCRLQKLSVSLFACMIVTAILGLVHRVPGSVAYFGLPIAATCGIVVWQEWFATAKARSGRNLSLFVDIAVFSLGTVVPICLFLIPFVTSGALGGVWHGLFVAPRLRLTHAVVPPPQLSAYVSSLPLATVIGLGFWRRQIDQWFLIAASLPLTVLVFWPASSFTVFHYCLVNSARCLLPFLVLIVCWRLLLCAGHLSPVRRQELFLLLSSSVFVNLLQFPYTTMFYACYIFPLIIVFTLYIARSQPHPPNLLYLYLLLIFLFFAVFILNGRSMFQDWESYLKDPPIQILDLPRAGLRVSQSDKDTYERLVRFIQKVSRPNSFILATPDCPQIYFLAQRKNPTRSMFEFFHDPRCREKFLLRLLEEGHIDVVVINIVPPFSSPVTTRMLEVIYEHYPDRQTIGDFVIAYRRPICQEPGINADCDAP